MSEIGAYLFVFAVALVFVLTVLALWTSRNDR